MPQDITTTIYTFDELSDEAKERARAWYREGGFDYEWWDSTYEDAYRVAELMGLDIEPQGKDDRKHGISFSGFWSQGDGACFQGVYRLALNAEASVREYAPQDTVLHGIAQQLEEAQEGCGYTLSTTIRQQGHYYHSGCMSFDHTFNSEEQFDQVALENEVEAALRQFADWIYRQLEQGFNYLTSDEAVDETIVANEYTFDLEGNRCG